MSEHHETPHPHDWCSCDGDGRVDRPAPEVPGLSRRHLLTGGLLGAIGWLASGRTLGQASFQIEPEHDHVLVNIFLRGGADGLNMVTPYGEDEYYRARPTLGMPAPTSREVSAEERLIRLDDRFGLHPAMGSLMPLYEDGSLALVHAVGSNDDSRSHFQAMEVMERGAQEVEDSAHDGWLARHLTTTPGREHPLRAIAFGNILPQSLAGATQGLAIRSLLDLAAPGDEAYFAQLEAMYGVGEEPLQRAGHEMLRVLKTLRGFNPDSVAPMRGADYPRNEFGQTLRQVAFLIRQGVGLEVACLDLGGWDTHVAQGRHQGGFAQRSRALADGLAAFVRDLGPDMRRVTVLVQSEFGRRMQENSGRGTDHGRGGVMFALGAAVAGGRVAANWPGLSAGALEGPGDLRVTTDYRSILRDVLAGPLANPRAAEVFPGAPTDTLGVIRA